MADPEAQADNPKKISLFSSDGDSMAPGQFGTYACFALMIVGVVASIVTQRYAPDNINLDVWEDGCPTGFLDSCKASSAVLRISFALTLIYFLQACGTFVYTKFYDILWVPKSFTFVALVIGFYFAETSVFDTNGYAWFARIIAFGYVILQQIILLDVAYCWNERWLEYAGEDHSQPIWLVGLLVISTVLIAGSIAAIGLMFWQFAGCPETDVILSLTVVLCFIAAMLQLFFTEHGSILTTAIMCSYAAYVAYSAVSINPEEKCNPTLNSGYQTLSIVIGMFLTVVSLTWTTYNTVRRIPEQFAHMQQKTINLTGLVVPPEDGKPAQQESVAEAAEEGYNSPGLGMLLTQVSFIFLLVSGYYAMILTNWATLQDNTSIANPKTGQVAMWIQASGQWIAILVYIWSLFAPYIMTDREF